MDLPRVQLFEFNDQPWVPESLRDTIVETLSRSLEWGRMLKNLVEPFREFVTKSEATEVLDIGAGAGGPARILVSEFLRGGMIPPKFVLTDLHPRVEIWENLTREFPDHVTYLPQAVDATHIPDEIAHNRVRSVINVFHHFSPSLAEAIIDDAVKSSRGIFISEAFTRDPSQFVLNFPHVALPALAVSSLVSPKDRAAKAFWSLSPIGALVGAWDGLISTLRVYSQEELLAMVAKHNDVFEWTYGVYSYRPWGRGYYFYGIPRKRT